MTARHEAPWVPDTQAAGEHVGRHRMPTSREELEHAIWCLMGACNVTVNAAVPFVDTLLLLADAYSAGDSETLTRLRREVLHRESRPL